MQAIFTFNNEIHANFMIFQVSKSKYRSILCAIFLQYCKLSAILQIVALTTNERRVEAVRCDKNLV